MAMNALHQAFPDLTDDQRDRLLELAEEKTLPSGNVIIQQHEAHDFLGIVATGNARVLQESYDHTNVEFTGPLGPGDVFGEMSFIDRQPSSATLVSDGDMVYLSLKRDAVDALIAYDPEMGMQFYHSILKTICRRLRQTNVRVQPA